MVNNRDFFFCFIGFFVFIICFTLNFGVLDIFADHSILFNFLIVFYRIFILIGNILHSHYFLFYQNFLCLPFVIIRSA